MRAILFRGKTDSGQWAEGYYVRADWYLYERVTHFIFSIDTTLYPHCELSGGEEIDPKTLGQYTGLTDKNGKKIFEGDVVSTDLKRPYNIVVFRDGCFMFNCNDGNQDYYDIMLPILQSENTRYEYGEVIGNIYDNPELLRSDIE